MELRRIPGRSNSNSFLKMFRYEFDKSIFLLWLWMFDFKFMLICSWSVVDVEETKT